jgi:hypothetical protein
MADISSVIDSGNIGSAMNSDAWNAYASNAMSGTGINWGDLASKYGSKVATLIGAGLGASGLLGSNNPQKSGYQGKIPSLTATRQQLPIDYNADRRPGSGGRRYFTDMTYGPKTGIASVAPAAPVAPVVETPPAPTVPVDNGGMVSAAHGGMIGYAQGGLADLGYYLGGQTDGMADKIPAKIDDKQQAKLSHGEFVVPADIVSALGSGNSSAGARVLYDMMDRIRKHAHGTTKQIKPANLKKTLPA